MEGVEIERKFLVSGLPEYWERHPSDAIEQGYLAIGEGGAEVRVRRTPGGAWLTAKRGHGEKRMEGEISLTAEQLDRLWPLTEGARIAKRRFRVPAGERTIEVDVYEGDLSGLVVAEVEFPTEDAADGFEPPDWLGDELTGDQRYANEHLATHGAPPAGIRSRPGSPPG